MPRTDHADLLKRITTLGGLLGIKTAPVVGRWKELATSWDDPVIATIPHYFNAMSITASVSRETARSVCGEWLDRLPGDRIGLELGTTTTVAHSDEAAFPSDAPELVRTLGDELASVAWDGEASTCAITQSNADAAAVDATIARFDAVAAALGVTDSQRRIGARLHNALARSMPTRVWLRARNGKPDPILGLSWDLVEWQPIQHMMAGFYPDVDTATKISRLARATNIEHATCELVLGPADPPAMRILVRL